MRKNKLTVGELINKLRIYINKWNWFKRRKHRKIALLEEQERSKQVFSWHQLKRTEQETVQQSCEYKPDWQEFKDVLQTNGIKKFYHFTDSENINSIIKNGGLYSWYYCLKNNIYIKHPGGSSLSRDLDILKGLQNYVRISFIVDHPMMYIAQRRQMTYSPMILEINTDVIFEMKTIFTTQNATKNGVIASGSLETFKSIDFSLFKKNYLELSEIEKSYYMAEVLVYEHIPLRYINIKEYW
jgi:hypothetical protein